MTSLQNLMSMTDRVVLVTGGAGHIGRAISSGLLDLGASIVLVDRNQAALDAAKAQLASTASADVETLCIDLEAEEQRKAIPERVQERFGRLDVLVNNAGFVGDSTLTGWSVPFEQQSMDTWRRAIEVNMTAAFHLCQLLTPLLRVSGHGSIINISSIYGNVGPDMGLYEGTGMGNPAAYAVSKGGIVQMTRWLSTVLAPDIRVNCVSPGGVARNQPESFADRYVSRTPMKRMGHEDDFKGAIAYFASDLSGWVTGQNLMVDGGWTAW